MGQQTELSEMVCAYPLRLEPQFVERVWGAPSEEISFLYAPAVERGQRIGEVWLTGNDNRIANGPLAGKTVREQTSACGASLLGNSSILNHPSGEPTFPLLVKFLFTTDKLSVQVHPPDSYAARQRSWGKTEMWHILRAAPGARLAVGFRKDLPPESLSDADYLRKAARTGELEQLLDWQKVHAGETFLVPAGTVHAIGAGLTLCEIQQNSDITYRLYDYNRPGTDGRPRPLHVEQALEVIAWHSAGGRTSPLDWTSAAAPCRLLAACPYFVTERWDFRQASGKVAEEKQILLLASRDQNDSARKRLEIWIALEGAAEFEAGGVCVRARAGEVVIIPAAVTAYELRPQSRCVFLRTFPPDWENDVLRPLRAAGLSPEQRDRVCFPLAQRAGEQSG